MDSAASKAGGPRRGARLLLLALFIGISHGKLPLPLPLPLPRLVIPPARRGVADRQHSAAGVSRPLHPGQNATTTGTFYDGCTLSYYANCLNQTDALAFCRARGGDLATYTTPTGLVGGYSRCGLCLHCRAGWQ